jgi:large subunit ribosomal protein L22
MAIQRAQLNYLRMTPRKVRAVADLVRGLSVNEAEAQLLYLRRRAAKPLLKLLRSAAKSAEITKKMEPEKLYIETLTVDQGPMLKRYLPRARGSASPIQRKMSHVTIVLGERAEASARYRIVVEKKAKKLPESEGGPSRKKRIEKERGGEPLAAEEPKKERGGVLRRIFRRKSI